MIPDNVTLIVKAPNQQIEDQNVECQSSWTVGQLKGYLSEVYPNKPRTDEQKIIYSGQLLDDNVVLKDILRTYESQLIHTMHLVCTPKRKMVPEHEPTTLNTEGLRRRNIASETRDQPVETSRPETRQNDQNHTVEMQNYLNSFVNNYGRVPPHPPNYNFGLPLPNDPALLANHMMVMQQAYLHYMQQYANMWQATGNATMTTGPTPGAVPEAASPPPQAPPPAPAPPVDEEEAAGRDWLDHLYTACRLAILFSLVYLYGSPARLLLVLLLAAAGYLHQIGFFRDLQEGQAPANLEVPAGNLNRPGGNRNLPGDNHDRLVNNQDPPADNNEQLVNNHEQQPDIEARSGTTVNPAATNTNDNQQSLLAVTWMIFTSFFASLIPETS